ncbi:MAG: tetratricopeptide repeat protein [Legionellales bacterium]
MSEWWLVGVLIVFSLVAGLLLVYPLRRHVLFSWCLMLAIYVLVAGGYFFWGGFVQWRHYIVQNKSQALAQQMLHSIKNPQELIDKLRAKLDDSAKSAKGWYLLGRLYLSQNDPQHAFKAFAKAHQLQPEDEQYTVNYTHSLWQMNHQKFTPEIRTAFTQLLTKNPQQADALAMLAMDAFERHAYEEAITYWQRLLKLAPPGSEEAQAIHKAIAKAQQQML